ncbi:MAG: hypothetical protein N2691_02700 [Patescibacteria group bacterium]|nr:hypothetical protein [Patescibacteria group bacterium]
MLSLIALVGVLIFVLIEINKTVREAVDSARAMINDLKQGAVNRVQGLLDDGSGKVITALGMGAAGFLLNAVKNKLFGKKRS